ncbi:hypothetical protein GGQ57_000123 [Parabacteroides faecis]|uniref:Uncharacterized protein n=1 Tax=Parabacteroides faecis TaxID=1217282 RepID=A0ABR6KHI1_9BACT|nr:hypothetical protein [Parabacteroides faecis]
MLYFHKFILLLRCSTTGYKKTPISFAFCIKSRRGEIREEIIVTKGKNYLTNGYSFLNSSNS